MQDLLARLIATLERKLDCVYCAVVATRGSTPQKAGAAMLVFPDGTQAGTLGGGCVEAAVKRRAIDGLISGVASIEEFLLDDDDGWADGLICGGRMTILTHPVFGDGPSHSLHVAYYSRLYMLAERGDGFTEALVIADTAGLPVGDRYLFDSTGKPESSLAVCPEWATVAAHLAPLGARPRPSVHHGVAYLPTPAQITLLLVGGGHVGQAVSRLAAEVGFRIWALDDRERYVNADRFPAADRLIVGPIGASLQELAPHLGPTTYAVVMTRGHGHDEEALYHLARSECAYVGMIGSRRKVRLIFDDLAAKGIAPESLGRVRAPVGFDIGSQTVPEIAVSIVAELIAWRNLGPVRVVRGVTE